MNVLKTLLPHLALAFVLCVPNWGSAQTPAPATPATVAEAATVPAAPAATGSLLVTVNVEGAKIEVDGVEVGISPAAPTSVTVGSHRIRVSLANYATVLRVVDVAENERERVDIDLLAEPTITGSTSGTADDGGADLSASPWYARWYVIAGAAVVVAAIVTVAVVLTLPEDSKGTPVGIPAPRITR